MMDVDVCSNILEKFLKLTKKPEKYLIQQHDVSNDAKELTKTIYDFTKNEEGIKNINTLPELIISEFDEEQIWQEIELQNESVWASKINNISKLISKKNKLFFPFKKSDDKEGDIDDDDINGDENYENLNSYEDADEILDDDKEEVQHKSRSQAAKIPGFKKSSELDDKFFNLKELNNFLDSEDKKEAKKNKKINDQGSDDEAIDYFEDMDSEDSDEDDENPIKYEDFFDGPNESFAEDEETSYSDNNSDQEDGDISGDDESEIEDEERMSKPGKKIDNKEKKVRFDIEDSTSNTGENHNNKKVNDSTVSNELSEYEIRQNRLKKKIEALEIKNLSEKPWPLKGEVDASSRPQNSLLEQVVDFDLTTRPAPIITEETTLKLEDIIKQRIKDKIWDDVERKIKPVEDPREFKKNLILDHEKSKLSLAQVYEQEYIKQREAVKANGEVNEEESKEHKEIKNAMKKLFEKLDALCNYHYTPKSAVPEIKILSNIPAINMEDVAPVATSDAALLAPEEIKGKPKGELMSKSERTTTDKKRERRKKKIMQHERQKKKENREKAIEKQNPGVQKRYTKDKASGLLEKLSKERNIEKMTLSNNNKALKSSKTFFSQLQEDITSSIKSKDHSKKKNKAKLSAKLLKL